MAKSPRRSANMGFRAEQRVAKALGAKKVGGPGRHDFELDGKLGENKHHAARRIHAGHVRKAHRHGSQVINASGPKGFSKGAKRLAKELGIEVRHVRPVAEKAQSWWHCFFWG